MFFPPCLIRLSQLAVANTELTEFKVVIGMTKERLFCPYYSSSFHRGAYSHVFEISIEKKQSMVDYSPQSFHLNGKKEDLKRSYHLGFFVSCPNDLSKN